MVTTNTKVFCKNNIDNLTKDWPGGYYLVLKIKNIVPWDMSLIAIDYKYKTRKVLSFISTEDTRRTNSGIIYLSN